MTKEDVAINEQDQASKLKSDIEAQNKLNEEMARYEELKVEYSNSFMDTLIQKTEGINEKLDITLPLESSLSFFTVLISSFLKDGEDEKTTDRMNHVSTMVLEALEKANEEIKESGEALKMTEVHLVLANIMGAHLSFQREQNILHRIRGESK